MENGALKLHISQVLHKVAHAPPQLARLVLRSGVFIVVSQIEQKAEDKLIWTLPPESCSIGFTSKGWNLIIAKAKIAQTEYINEQNAKNT